MKANIDNSNLEFIPFARPSIGEEEEKAVIKVLRSGWLTTGNETLAFEKEFADFVSDGKATGDLSALAVNSATSGLHLALESCGVGKGDIIITSPYTFTSTAEVAIHLGAEIRFCDTKENSCLIDPVQLERILAEEKNCKAVIVVHVAGLVCDMKSIKQIIDAYKKKSGHDCTLIEDSAHSFPSKTKLGMAGTIGDIGVYSFYATKTITTGEGGMVVSCDESKIKRMSHMRLHGFDREAWNRYTSTKPAWVYSITEAGYKYNLPDILAAIGREQLKKAYKFLEERKEIASIYDKAFSRTDKLILPEHGEGHAWHLYAIRANSKTNCPSRDKIISDLAENKIGTSVHFIPLHIMPYYSKRYNLKPMDFPNAYSVYENSLSLPIWQGMGTEKANRIANTVLDICGDTI